MKDKLLNSLIGRTISILLMVILIFCSIRTDVFAMEKDASVEQVTGERGIERELTIQGEEVYEGRGFRIISGVLDNWETGVNEYLIIENTGDLPLRIGF